MSHLFMLCVFVPASVKLPSAPFPLEGANGVLGLISSALTSQQTEYKRTLQSSDVEAMPGV